MADLLQVLRHALRALRARPTFTATVVATLAIGIGASTAIFGIVNAALLRPLPFAEPERLAFLWGVAGPERDVRGASYLEVRDWREGSRTLAGVSAYEELALNLRVGDEAARVEAERVSAGFFELLGVRAWRGRTFLAEEDRVADAAPVAVVSHALWRTRLGGDPGIVGRAVRVNDRPFTIVGVMPPGFRGVSFETDLWIPMTQISVTDAPVVLERRGSRWLGAVGRLAEGTTLPAAQRELDGVAARLAREHPETNTDRGVQLLALHDYYVGDTRPLLLVLLAAVGLFLLIACANVAALQLVRAAGRRREMAVRSALGASGRQLLRPVLAEAVLLSVLSTGVGILVAVWATRLLLPLVPDGVLPGFVVPALDARVLLFGVALTTLVAALLAVVAALHGRRRPLAGVLRDGGRSAAGGILSLSRPGAQQLIVVGEVALALVLLAGAGLMVRSVQRQLAVDPGFRPAGVLQARLELPALRYTAEEAGRAAAALTSRLAGRPGVRAVAVGSDVPMDGNTSAALLAVPGGPDEVRYYRHRVTPGYFAALGIPVVRGRDFDASDHADVGLVAVVSETMAARYWPAGDALGRQLRLGPDTATIVGVVGTARFRDLTTDLSAPGEEPDVYLPLAQRPTRGLTVVLRGSGDPTALVEELRAAVTALDAGLVLFEVQPLEEALHQQTATSRFAATMLGLFAGAALVLATVGLSGLVAFIVGLSGREIAIRMALGATGGGVVRLMVRQGLALVVAGLLLGLLGTLAATRLLESQLFGVSPTDPATLLTVSIGLLTATLVASWLPARRATLVEPQRALRGD